jgi:NAD(P)H-nitrite reductase large subunit
MNYLIIGGGVAALGAIDGIRSIDATGKITLVTNEAFPPYSRPGISYWLSGKLADWGMPLRDEAFYREAGVTILTDTRAVTLETKKKTVATDRAGTIAYDRLLLATGGAPIIPPIEGIAGTDMVFTFTTYNDALTISAKKDRIKRAVVVGGGLIGLKAAEALNDIGISVTVVELMDRILSLAFDKTAGDLMKKRLEKAGIAVITGDSVTAVTAAGGSVSAAKLGSGAMIDTDALVVAVGVKPDTALAAAAGIKVNRGILVDQYLMTSAPDVFAAGDVVEAYDLAAKDRRVTPILPNASRQGRQAGRNMAGAAESYEGGLPMNSIGFYGLSSISVGLVNPAEDSPYRVVTRLDETCDIYRKLIFDDGRLVGAVLVGDVARAGIFFGLVRDGTPVTGMEEKMLSTDFGHVHFDKEVRAQRLKRS